MSLRHIALFDCLGFESIIDITCDENHRIECLIHDEEDPQKGIISLINKITLRARMNPQRLPEVWIFWSDIDSDTLMKSANENPQMMANLIREKGIKIFTTPKEKSVIS
jgi:hypothetical protein